MPTVTISLPGKKSVTTTCAYHLLHDIAALWLTEAEAQPLISAEILPKKLHEIHLKLFHGRVYFIEIPRQFTEVHLPTSSNRESALQSLLDCLELPNELRKALNLSPLAYGLIFTMYLTLGSIAFSQELATRLVARGICNAYDKAKDTLAGIITCGNLFPLGEPHDPKNHQPPM